METTANSNLPENKAPHTNTPETDLPAANQDTEWTYSGKAMRGQFILLCLFSLILIGGGLYATFADLLGTEHGSYYTLTWYSIGGGLVLLWGYYYAVYFYRVLTIRYKLTDQRLYVYHGLLTRTTDSMELVYIEDVRLEQTLFDRIFNGSVGKLIIYCPADRTDKNLVLRGVDKPLHIFEKIDTARAAIRAKRSILTGG
jgi:uncharacterized membrane protein YdbT with pleckstrin-like domain